MTAHIKVESSGSLILPKRLLDLKGWLPGTELEVQDTADGIVLRSRVPATPRVVPIDWEEFRRGMPIHEGPPASLADMDRAIEKEAARRWKVEQQQRTDG